MSGVELWGTLIPLIVGGAVVPIQLIITLILVVRKDELPDTHHAGVYGRPRKA